MLNRRLYLVVPSAVFAAALSASTAEVRISTIVFSSNRLGNLDIYLMDVD